MRIKNNFKDFRHQTALYLISRLISDVNVFIPQIPLIIQGYGSVKPPGSESVFKLAVVWGGRVFKEVHRQSMQDTVCV